MQHKFFRQKRLSSSLRPAEGEEWREPLLDEKQRYPNSRCRKNEDEEENLFYMFLKKKCFSVHYRWMGSAYYFVVILKDVPNQSPNLCLIGELLLLHSGIPN